MARECAKPLLTVFEALYDLFMIEKFRYEVVPSRCTWSEFESNSYLYRFLTKRYLDRVNSKPGWNLYNLALDTHIWSYGVGEGEDDYFNLHIGSPDKKKVSVMVLNYKSLNSDLITTEYINEFKEVVNTYNLKLVLSEDKF